MFGEIAHLCAVKTKYVDSPDTYDAVRSLDDAPHGYGYRHFYRIDMLVRDKLTGSTISHHFYCSCCKSVRWMSNSFCDYSPDSVDVIFEPTEIGQPPFLVPHVTTMYAYRGLYQKQFVEAMLKLHFKIHLRPLFRFFFKKTKKLFYERTTN